MKIFGCVKSDTEIEVLNELSCIAFPANPDVLRAVAKYINEAADELEEMGDEFSHVHLMDEWSEWQEGMPDIQVVGENP